MVSLVFVFAAMVEFAVVLFLKQIQEWEDITEKDNHYGNRFNSNKINKANTSTEALPEANTVTTPDGNSFETGDEEMRQMRFWERKRAILHGLPLTTKIDFTGFVFFHLFYLIFNCVFVICVMKVFY